MKLAIYDKGNGDFKPTARKTAVAVFAVDSVPDFKATHTEAVDKLRTYSHIICHLEPDEVDPSWPKLIQGPLTDVSLIIRVSSVGRNGMLDSFKTPYRLNGTGPWILHLIGPSGQVSEEKWIKIFKAIKDWDTFKDGLPTTLAAIFVPHPEFRLALRLLCEAWMFVENKETATGITVHAPVKPSEWFDPFDLAPPTPLKDESEEEEDTRLKEYLTPVVSFMGDTEKEALAIFKAVVNGKSLKTPVGNFLEKFPSSKRSDTNPAA